MLGCAVRFSGFGDRLLGVGLPLSSRRCRPIICRISGFAFLQLRFGVSGQCRAWGLCRASGVWRRSPGFRETSLASIDFLVSSSVKHRASGIGSWLSVSYSREALGLEDRHAETQSHRLKIAARCQLKI